MTMQEIKQDLKEAQQFVKDAHDAAGGDKMARAYYTIQAWGLGRMIDTVDFIRSLKHLLHQKQK